MTQNDMCLCMYRLLEGRPVWQITRKYNLLEKSEGRDLALQWECVGPGIQGNTMGLPDVQERLFNVYDIARGEYVNYRDWLMLLVEIGLGDMRTVDTYTVRSRSRVREQEEVKEGRYDCWLHAR